jgi:predicted glycosyltransferase
MRRIWIDLDNSPHVPLFRPIIEELGRREVECVITARDFAQTGSLLDFWGIPYQKIGRHGGKRKTGKILNLFSRANELRRYIRGRHVDLAVSHGSRTQLVASKYMGIESIVMMDYEYTESRIFNYCADHIMVPRYIPDARLESVGINMKKVVRYSGFKEELYLGYFSPEPGFRMSLGISDEKILVTIRPPAMEGNYHDSLSETILLEILRKLTADDGVYPLIVGRTKKDRRFLEENFDGKIHFLEKAVDGLQLIWASDIFISGGGSMNRESALLGVPTYSIFTGRKPYLDEHLAAEGRLTFIDSLEKIGLLEVQKREFPTGFIGGASGLVGEVVNIILSF